MPCMQTISNIFFNAYVLTATTQLILLKWVKIIFKKTVQRMMRHRRNGRRTKIIYFHSCCISIIVVLIDRSYLSLCEDQHENKLFRRYSKINQRELKHRKVRKSVLMLMETMNFLKGSF